MKLDNEINYGLSLGKGEVVCSIHTGSTEEAQETKASDAAPETISAVSGRTEHKPDRSECGESVDFVHQTFGTRRPKVMLRRAPTELHHAINEYRLNRGTQAEAVSLENLCRAIRRG